MNMNQEKEILYNGIHLPDEWPPKDLDTSSHQPLPVPCLEDPPEVIPINIGRQLFVDDFLIESTTLGRCFHKARLHSINPVLKPETALEMNQGKCPVAAPFNDGVWYDPVQKQFKMWYHAGWFDGIGYAVSENGIDWHRPMLDILPGTNRVIPVRAGYQRDGAMVWLDQETSDPKERYKMFAYFRHADGEGGEIRTSHDGIHWSDPKPTGPCGDNTSFFYNPFRKKWVYSIRSGKKVPGRVRLYREHDSFIEGGSWTPEDCIFWSRTDHLDQPDPEMGNWFRSGSLYTTQLYDLNAVPYESIMLGIFGILKGYDNDVCTAGGLPKINDFILGYSRDGFHWDRPDRTPFLAATRTKGDWNRAYLHAAGGVCLVVGDLLYFYFGAWSGNSPVNGESTYAGGSTGLAVLRRDGFASMNASFTTGSLTTKPVLFQNGKYLFVNANTENGMLQVEVLDKDGRVIEPFTRDNSKTICKDSTCHLVEWADGNDLSKLRNQPVKFLFYLTNGQLYSFWVSPENNGASHGYVAAGGPGFTAATDTVGNGIV